MKRIALGLAMMSVAGCTHTADFVLGADDASIPSDMANSSLDGMQILPDASRDGTVVDGTVIDATIADGTIVDGTVIDATIADGTIVDGTVIDATIMDGTVLDGTVVVLPDADLLPDATIVPDASGPVEERLLRTVYIEDSTSMGFAVSCNDDEDPEEVGLPIPGASPGTGGLISTGTWTCNAIKLPSSTTDTATVTIGSNASYTLAFDGHGNSALIPEESTSSASGVYHTHFANFYRGSSGVTFYDSSANPQDLTKRIGNMLTDFGDVTDGTFELDRAQAYSWHFGVSIDSDVEPEFWFEYEADELSSETPPVLNFFLTGDSDPQNARLYVQQPSGEGFLTLEPIFDDRIEFRHAYLGRRSSTGVFGTLFGGAIEVACPGPGGEQIILAGGPALDSIPRNFSEIWAWPNICSVRDMTTHMEIYPEFPFPIEYDGVTLYIYGSSTGNTIGYPILPGPLDDGELRFDIVNLSERSSTTVSPLTLNMFTTTSGISSVAIATDLAASTSTTYLPAPSTTPSAFYLYGVSDTLDPIYYEGFPTTSGHYIIYIVDYQEFDSLGVDYLPTLIVQLPPGSPEQFIELSPAVG